MAMTMATMGRRIKNFDIVYFPAESLVEEVGAASAGFSCGATGAPSFSFCRLSVMTVVPGCEAAIDRSSRCRTAGPASR